MLGEQRGVVRQMYGIGSVDGSDECGCHPGECAAPLFCGPCAFMQLAAEMEVQCCLVLPQ